MLFKARNQRTRIHTCTLARARTRAYTHTRIYYLPTYTCLLITHRPLLYTRTCIDKTHTREHISWRVVLIGSDQIRSDACVQSSLEESTFMGTSRISRATYTPTPLDRRSTILHSDPSSPIVSFLISCNGMPVWIARGMNAGDKVQWRKRRE